MRLGYVVGDSDVRAWIGTLTDPYNNHVTLSDAILLSMVTEVNLTSSTSARVAELNAGNIAGNVLTMAAEATDTTPDDKLKIEKVTFKSQQGSGCYTNLVSVVAPGASAEDSSGYCQPRIDIEKKTTGTCTTTRSSVSA